MLAVGRQHAAQQEDGLRIDLRLPGEAGEILPSGLLEALEDGLDHRAVRPRLHLLVEERPVQQRERPGLRIIDQLLQLEVRDAVAGLPVDGTQEPDRDFERCVHGSAG